MVSKMNIKYEMYKEFVYITPCPYNIKNHKNEVIKIGSINCDLCIYNKGKLNFQEVNCEKGK